MSEAERHTVALRLAAELARATSEGEAAAAASRAAGLLIGADCVRVWMIDRNHGYRFAGHWPDGDQAPESPPADLPRVIAFGSSAASAADPPYRSRLIVPLLAGHRPLGAVELLERQRSAGPLEAADADSLRDLIEAADAALEGVRKSASVERGRLEAIMRLTRLFDLGRTIAGALEMEQLARVIVNRVVSAFDIENAYLWLPDESGEVLSVNAAAGPVAETVLGWELPVGEGAAGTAVASGEAMLFDDETAIPGIDERPDLEGGVEINTLIVVPIVDEDEQTLGVLEAVNRDDGESFDESDLAVMREIAETAAIAIGNVRRFDAERRASDLTALLSTAQELGTHLDVQKVTFALVHQAASVLAYRRAAVGLFANAGFRLVAVSGDTFVDEKLPEMKALKDLLTWAAALDDGLYVVQEDDGSIDTDRPETREKFRAYFETTGSRSFLTVPMRDDEGRIGVYCLEAAEPYAFGERDLEIAGLLGAQATLALRNALLYERIPMARVFQPLAQKKERWLRQSVWGRYSRAGAVTLLAAVLIFVPVPLRVGGRVRVLPERRLPVTAEVEGRIDRVLVREGEVVDAGQVVALINDSEYRAGHEEAQAELMVATREQSRLRADGLQAAAAIEAARLQGLRAELELWESRLDHARLRTPVAGLVATPRVDELVGTKLARGEVFCEVVSPELQMIEIAVSESDAGLLDVGMPVRVKLNAYPTRSLPATVEHIGVTASLEDAQRVFLVRARLDRMDVLLRSGMTGQAKINTGPASLGRVIFRRPARWLWSVLWGWLP